jgi:hypothetical protein
MKDRVLFLVGLVVIACSHGGDTRDSSMNGGQAAPSTIAGSAAEQAVKEYVVALTNGNLDGFFKYDQDYVQAAEKERQSVPSSMWRERETRLQSQFRTDMNKIQKATEYDPTGPPIDRACFLILKVGGRINSSKLEVRQLPDGHSQAFVQVDYTDQASAPAVLWQGTRRKLKSAMLRLGIEPNGQGLPLVNPLCETVEGALTVWDTPG